jgi:hypothetical protein
MLRATSPLSGLFVLIASASALASPGERPPKALWKMDEVKGAAFAEREADFPGPQRERTPKRGRERIEERTET